MEKIKRRCGQCGQWVTGEVVENASQKTGRIFSKKLVIAGVSSLLGIPGGPVGFVIGGIVGYGLGKLLDEGINELESQTDMDYKFTCPNPNCKNTWTEHLVGASTISHPVSRKETDRKNFYKGIAFLVVSILSLGYCVFNDSSHRRHVDGNIFSLYKDFEVTDYNYLWFILGLVGIVFLIKGYKLVSNIKFSSLSDKDFVVQRVDVCVCDEEGNIIVDYGQPIYHSQATYLKPRLIVNVANEGIYDISYKFYCNGELSLGNSGLYTCSNSCDFYANTTSCIMTGFGNDSPNFWPVGKYRFEFFCNGKNIGNKDFEVLEG